MYTCIKNQKLILTLHNVVGKVQMIERTTYKSALWFVDSVGHEYKVSDSLQQKKKKKKRRWTRLDGFASTGCLKIYHLLFLV